MQVSGVFCEVLCDAVGNAVYMRTTGPTQLAYGDREIIGHGVDYHAEGFGSPIGHLKDFSRCLSLYTIDELKAHDINVGRRVTLEYLSGVTVEGVLQQVHRQDHRNLVLSFTDCSVQDLQGRILFDPAWGGYDLAVGSAISSVYGGVADREKLQLYKPTPKTETLRAASNQSLMSCYQLAADLKGHSPDESQRRKLHAALEAYPREWLLRAELLELEDSSLHQQLIKELAELGGQSAELSRLTAMVLDSQ
jgi:phenylalanine-4-hydroxylase